MHLSNDARPSWINTTSDEKIKVCEELHSFLWLGPKIELKLLMLLWTTIIFNSKMVLKSFFFYINVFVITNLNQLWIRGINPTRYYFKMKYSNCLRTCNHFYTICKSRSALKTIGKGLKVSLSFVYVFVCVLHVNFYRFSRNQGRIGSFVYAETAHVPFSQQVTFFNPQPGHDHQY